MSEPNLSRVCREHRQLEIELGAETVSDDDPRVVNHWLADNEAERKKHSKMCGTHTNRTIGLLRGWWKSKHRDDRDDREKIIALTAGGRKDDLW